MYFLCDNDKKTKTQNLYISCVYCIAYIYENAIYLFDIYNRYYLENGKHMKDLTRQHMNNVSKRLKDFNLEDGTLYQLKKDRYVFFIYLQDLP